jgi:hypothetical protein
MVGIGESMDPSVSCILYLGTMYPLGDLLDVRLLPGGAPLRVAPGYSKPSSQEKHPGESWLAYSAVAEFIRVWR